MERAADEPVATAMPATILVVDDESLIRELLSEILEHAGYAVDTARDGVDALSRIAGRDYSAVISDACMPRMGGIELYRELARRHPDLASRFLLVTGDSLGGAIRAFLDETGVPCIGKPFRPGEIRMAIAGRLGAPSPRD